MRAVTSLPRQTLLFLLLAAFSLVTSGCPLNSDDDGDGFSENEGDCNDEDGTIYPGAFETLCDGIDQDCDTIDPTDGDGDSFSACAGADPFDCDDDNDEIFPGATEECDLIDHDCDGDPTNGLLAWTWWVDNDADGYGAGDLEVTCEDASPSSEHVSADDADADCNDTDPLVNPDATEICDAADNNCDGDVDEGFDADEDGVTTCGDDGQPGNLDDDCDDDEAESYPGNTEVCDDLDNDCNGLNDEGFDVDGDGVKTCGEDGVTGNSDDDCDDGNADNFPGNTEVCEGEDNDCDEVIDNGFDTDSDGFTTCGEDGSVGTADDDCDDSEATTNPDGTEVCDGVDNNCAFGIDEPFDVDTDGVTSCGPDGTPGTADDDCDDTNDAVFPNNTELCDGLDNDCDTVADNGFDGDGDGVSTCGPDGVPGNVDDDCDDSDANNFPGNPEVCDAGDNDCDTVVDNGFDSDVDGVTTCGPDGTIGTADDDCDDADIANFPGNAEICDASDNDCDTVVDNGFDGDTDGVTSCGPDGIVGNADDDCDDADSANFPGNTEVCDGADNNCDTSVDDGLDGDTDGVTPCGPDGVAGNADDDCDDADIDTFPGATEQCDGVDNDCDTVTPVNETDGDSDTYIPCTLVAGATPPGITGGGDCDDGEAAINPGATEVCDGVDTDCAGGVPPLETDGDGDFYLVCSGFSDLGLGFLGGDDCDDVVAAVNPGATEVCDLVDNNCVGGVDEGFDGDLDTVTVCGADGINGTADDDCDDSNPAVLPGADEVCDLVDNDCDSFIDALDPSFLGADADSDGDSSTACGGTDCDDNDALVDGLDRDFDGETSCAGDCDDTDPTFRTTTVEACDGEDNDCNGLVDDGVGPDADGDGFDTSGCGFFGSDCMDTDAHVFPDETYTSGWQKQCMPTLRPGFGTSWAYARLNLPSYFQDPQTGTNYLYFRGHHNPDSHQFGYATSTNGTTWGDVQGPILSEDPGLGVWDGRRISHPTVAYIPGKARPYIMAYHALEDSGSERRIGVVTAETAAGDTTDGTFKRLTMSGAPITSYVVDTSTSVTAVDDERVLNPSLYFDAATSILHLWYTGRFGGLNEFGIAHASCDTTVSDCGLEGDWTKTDTSANGDPDVWLAGSEAWELKGNGGGNVQQTFVMAHSDPGNFGGYDIEVSYAGNGLEIGTVQGNVGDSSSWVKSPFNPALSFSSSVDRMDGQSVTGRGVRYDGTTGEYHMYYGTSVSLPSDATGEGTDVLWGPRNYSGGASYIGHAINNEPVVAISASSCSSLSGDITDNGPDSVGLRVFDGATEIVSQFFGSSTGNTNLGVQTTTWTTALGLAGGAHTLTVVATDQGGAERTDEVILTCP